jgi:hypothetical protein
VADELIFDVACMIHGKHLSLLSFGLLFGNDE